MGAFLTLAHAITGNHNEEHALLVVVVFQGPAGHQKYNLRATTDGTAAVLRSRAQPR